MKLDGKVAVVTGGGRNIGRAISLLFASEGAKIAIYDADRGRAAAVAEEVEAAGRVAYDVAKGGIISLTRDLAVQLAPHDIRTNAIAPGMSGSQVGARVAFEDRRPANLVGRAGHAEEQASVALFLASGDSAHVWGQTINVDGGSTVI
ncbi:MAG: SDR family oxidoreductase [Chloroflexi bacterium]|nr:SDR family oxidoreductase [Chloroflexota bacterium]MCH7656278.1 SDR family oxidoreductase [Chloroflexota bacterium]